jgi:hypothetical protein
LERCAASLAEGSGGRTRILSAVLVEGSANRVRIHRTEGAVPPGFAPTPATLEDAYLVLMRTPTDEIPPGLRRARREEVTA